MLETLREKSAISHEEKNIGKLLNSFFLLPLKSGLTGFAVFFTILVATKFLGFLLGSQPTFQIVLDDVFLSLIGFVLFFLIRFLENLKEK